MPAFAAPIAANAWPLWLPSCRDTAPGNVLGAVPPMLHLLPQGRLASLVSSRSDMRDGRLPCVMILAGVETDDG